MRGGPACLALTSGCCLPRLASLRLEFNTLFITEGYAARLTFKKAKEEGMVVAVQWQDADSSSSNAVTELFPDAKVMICGGHAGRAHKKQLGKISKMNQFLPALSARFLSVGVVIYHCSRHRSGCGCLSDNFIERARNNFSFILSQSQSAEEFATKMKALARHAHDEHEWDHGKCDFLPASSVQLWKV